MNNSEIIKAYEEEISKPQNHYIGTVGILWNVLGLIKRQQAEIERLNIDLKAMRGAANSYKAHYEDLKSENLETIKILKTAKSATVREFAEKLKKEVDFINTTRELKQTINRLVEEMGCNDG